jgi:hypothetical protein
MVTAVQAVAEASLTPRQLNSIRALQRKVETSPRSYMATTRVSEAQFKAMQVAYDAVKASGLPIDPVMAKHAKEIGLK